MNRAPLGVGEATALVLDGASALPAETVSHGEAYGRVVASDIRAPRNLPPWRNASMDGYAVRAGDIVQASAGAPVALRVVEAVAAGTLPTRTIGPGEAARIMTGAPVPDGADSVVRIEDTDRGRDVVVISNARDAGMNVRPRGEDLAAGDVAVPIGGQVDASMLGVLASIGALQVPVHRRPRVAVLSAGDELVSITEHARAMEEQRIVDVNAITIGALAAECGAIVTPLGLAADDPDRIRDLIAHAPPFDVLLTSGSVSVGDHDHMRDVLRSLGAEILIHRVRIRPGAPLAFGKLGDARWIGLPGNPVSAMVTFELFARPLLRRLAGHRRIFRATVPARVKEEIRTAAPLTHFLRVTLAPTESGVYEAAVTGPQGSGLLTSMARADGLLIVPESQRAVPARTILRAIPLRSGGFAADAQVA